jgi:hypothetical protein
LAVVAACASNPYSEPRAAWRAEADQACLARGYVQPSAYVQPMPRLGGRGSCGIDRPFKVAAASRGSVPVEPAATLNCPMIESIDRWMASSVQPAAQSYFGMRVVALRQMASYGCRTRESQRGERLSEHAFGNALDVAGFRLADGRSIVIASAWWGGGPQERAFLQTVFAGACREFDTVLGPGYNRAHANHFHLDLLETNGNGGRHVCRPEPSFQNVPVARAPGGMAVPYKVGSVAKPQLVPFVSKEDAADEGF